MGNYLHRTEKANDDILWNIPAKKQGHINIIGGNAQSFRTPVKIAEYVTKEYPLEEVGLVLPDALTGKLPNLPNIDFLGSTESGSFSSSEELQTAINAPDVSLVVGDLSKNAITGKALAGACLYSAKPTVITRDSVDLIADNCSETLLMNDNLIFFASMPQIIKLFHAVYYPKMITLTQSLLQVAEALHKFTLSYPTKIITLHNGQIILAENGNINVLSLENTHLTPIAIWSGEVAARIAVLNLYNPRKFLEASGSAFLA
ncbi:hypothetical protein IJ117_02585 [Candidatus Saccharibacteria bacterium]|nr:hypothetical protein [Candidatus Saccharibacteria bacterium]